MIPSKLSFAEHCKLALDLVSKAAGHSVAGLGENPPGIEIIHRFAPGLYIRECRIPANAMLVTKIHKTHHFFQIVSGHVLIRDAEGLWDIQAPFCGFTFPGTQRIIASLQDTVWLTFHPTDLTDPVEIERTLVEQVGD